MTMLLRTAARSDVGLIRVGNEDSGYAGPDLVVVADGMGGHAAGELASAIAVATVAQLETEGMADEDAIARLADAVEDTSERIADVIAADPELAGMGTTVTALAWLGNPARVALVHVGDSRGYLLRDDELSQLTRDHTYVQSLVDAGRITAAEAAVHPRRSLLMRAIDGIHPAEPDITVREARARDRFLICSDGLSGVVADEDLQRLLELPDPTAAVTALVDAALAGGAPENVTCVVADVVEVDDDGARPPTRPVVVGAAGELRVRQQLPGLSFPVDAEPDPDAEPKPTGEPAHVVRVNTAPDTRLEGPAALARVYAEEQGARRGRRWRVWLAVAVVVVLLLVAAFLSFGAWARGQWFVGESDGYVAVFNGVPGGIGPVSLHRVEEVSDLRVDQLPTFEAEQVQATGFAASQAAADETVLRLRARAQQCVTAPTTAGCPGATT
jgi:protein phosphatase